MHECEQVKVTGKCDAGCGADATQWYGNTAVATCGKAACVSIVHARYVAHCDAVDEEARLRGDDDTRY